MLCLCLLLPVIHLKLYLRLLHQSLIGRCCVCICYTTPSLECVVSAFASPSHSFKVVSTFATPVPHWKVFYQRLLHQSLIGSCYISVCYTSPSLECVLCTFASPSHSLKFVSTFTTPVPHWKVLYLRLLHQSLIGRCCIYVW